MELLNPLRDIPAEHCEATDALSFARVAGYIGEDDDFPVSKSDHPIHWPVARFSQELWDTAHALGQSQGMIATSAAVQTKHEQMVADLEEARADSADKEVRIGNLTEAMETTVKNCNEQMRLLIEEHNRELEEREKEHHLVKVEDRDNYNLQTKKLRSEIATLLEQIAFQNEVIEKLQAERRSSIKHRAANVVRFLVDLVDDPR
jgi:hypothetical protein